MKVNPLRSWRESKRIKAIDVALKIGVSEQSVLSYEKGRYEPSRENMEKLAKLMGEDLAKLNLTWRLWKKGQLSE